jgi:TonB-dependent SusC/RagA subfamily outer membrane receptor
LLTRWAHVAARGAALLTAPVAALGVVLLSACHPAAAPAAAPTPGAAPSLVSRVVSSAVSGETTYAVIESPALAAAEKVAAQIAHDRERAARMETGVAQSPHNAITADRWRDLPAARLEELIAGRVAGVYVVRTATGLSLRILGPNTVLGEMEPLVVLDGHPLQQGTQQLALINPADVARIEVLKDAGATSFYGVRGANGVILVTTKRR